MPPTEPPPTNPPPTVSGDFTVLAANDLGMHCADQDYRIFSILPPYNVLHAQVLRKGSEPEHMSPANGVQLTYRAVTGNIIDPNNRSAPTTSGMLEMAWQRGIRVHAIPYRQLLDQLAGQRGERRPRVQAAVNTLAITVSAVLVGIPL